MPIHDWTKVEAGIFHAFHHGWISELSNALNGGLLPPDYYALPEQVAAGFGPDVLALQDVSLSEDRDSRKSASTTVLQPHDPKRQLLPSPRKSFIDARRAP